MQCPRSISCVLVANELQCRTRVDHALPDVRRPTAQRGGHGVRPGCVTRSGRSSDARLNADRTQTGVSGTHLYMHMHIYMHMCM